MKRTFSNAVRRLFCGFLAAVLLLVSGCGVAGSEAVSGSAVSSQKGTESIVWTDALGYEVQLERWERVVSLYGSFAETWQLAGGTLVGVTEDAFSERGMTFDDETMVVGSVKQPNLEEIFAVQPDFVILSAEIEGQIALHEALQQAGIPHAYFQVDAFEDYLQMLQLFCEMTGCADLYEQNGLAVQQQIEQIKTEVRKAETAPTVLLLRAYSTGCKAKGRDNLTGVMLDELGAQNLVEQYESLLEDVSIEEIIAADPDIIFVSVMGSDEEKALTWLQENLASNPAWAGLTAIREERFYVLPKALFHYKPNARWAESYRQLAQLLYPDM